MCTNPLSTKYSSPPLFSFQETTRVEIEMQTNRTRPPPLDNYYSNLPKKISPLKGKQTVSVAPMMKRSREAKPAGNLFNTVSDKAHDVVEHTPIKKTRFVLHDKGMAMQSASPSVKQTSRQSREEGGMYTLSDIFNGMPLKTLLHPSLPILRGQTLSLLPETTNAYRIHLYNTTLNRITTTQNHLLESLHDSTLYHGHDPNNPDSSPIKLSIWTKLQQSSRYLYTPIGPTQLIVTVTNRNGEKEKAEQSLASRMTEFEKRWKSEAIEIREMHRKWEQIVGEIWKLGVQVLGEEKMKEMLLPVSSRPRDEEAEEERLLVVTSEDVDGGQGSKRKKRVSFQEPAFHILSQQTGFKKPVRPLPEDPVDEAMKLEHMIEQLGTMQMEEMKILNNEEQKWWDRKKQRIADAFREE